MSTFADALLKLISEPYTGPLPTHVMAEELAVGDRIVERDMRGKKTFHTVHGSERTGQYGHGHIVVSVGGRMMWRYEPETLVEIDPK